MYRSGPDGEVGEDERIARTRNKYEETLTACWHMSPYFIPCESNEHREVAKRIRGERSCYEWSES